MASPVMKKSDESVLHVDFDAIILKLILSGPPLSNPFLLAMYLGDSPSGMSSYFPSGCEIK